jgi:hypothetical protein
VPIPVQFWASQPKRACGLGNATTGQIVRANGRRLTKIFSMAKKRRTAKRSTRAGKGRPTAKHKRKAKPVKQDNTAPIVTNFDPTPYLIAADQRKLSAAVQATGSEINPPHELKAEGLTTAPPELGTPALEIMAGAGNLRLDSFVMP